MQKRVGTTIRFVATIFVFAVAAAACADDGGSAGEVASGAATPCQPDPDLAPVEPDRSDPRAYAGTELTLVAYDSFAVSDGVFEEFEADTGITVTVLTGGDTGAMVATAILNSGNPVADVMWGIDNTNLCRALDADVFSPYTSPVLDDLDAALILDPQHRVTPVDVSDICVNYWIDRVAVAPESLDDLRLPDNASTFVTQNPETSAPGMGFLLATIVEYGDEWESYWQDLADNGVAVTAGWEDAYSGEFIAGGGDRAIVTSYASSPVAEVLFAAEPIDTPPTAVVVDTCFRSIESAGILAGTDNPGAAALLVDFLAGPTMQADLALNNFVYPANTTVALPPEFAEFGPLADDPYTLSPEVIAANRDAWTDRWVEIVLG